MSGWPIFKGDNTPSNAIKELPPPPPWRVFGKERKRGETFQALPEEVQAVNAALFLRRPLLVTGKPGTGKSSLAYAVAHELRLASVLRWSITSRSTVTEGLYRYDAIGRMQEYQLRPTEPPDIGSYLHLGPLGTALLPSDRPRVLLVDELDKGDIDLPNDLLNIFEEGEYEIPELARLAKLDQRTVRIRHFDGAEESEIRDGHVTCTAFPFVVITSNGEREFSPAFLRRCLRLDLGEPDRDRLLSIVRAHLGDAVSDIENAAAPHIQDFLARRTSGDIAADQLLNAIFLITQHRVNTSTSLNELRDMLLRSLGPSSE
jgi:MoxR-like ATPase